MLAAVAAIEPITKLQHIFAFEPIINYIIYINSSRTIRKHRPRPHGPILLYYVYLILDVTVLVSVST